VLAIAHCGSRHPRARQAAVQALGAGESSVRIAALLAMGELAPNPELTAPLLHGLEATDIRVARAALWSCGKLRLKEAGAPIEQMMKRFPERSHLLAELALKMIRGETVDEAFYDEQRPGLDDT
jgi:HEAT repeat protein